ncbi:MAG: AAA family ATPase [Candidatus Hodarchaeales archaeon]|jgi:MoxR-like ATPase
MNKNSIIRQPVEIRYKKELNALKLHDKERLKPENWQLSPRSILEFIIGLKKPLEIEGKKIPITRKFYGDDVLIQRTIASLASERALMLIGEPGTAKSWLSENLAAAISGTSLNTIQGSAAVTEDQIKYSWNYALLLSKGPTIESLVPAPLLIGVREGKLVRFEEITRCPPEVQDVLLSVLSEKILIIPELIDGVYYAQKGFGLIATANTRDRGVNEMSSALKRRMNFETINPLKNIDIEMKLVTEQVENYLEHANIQQEVTPDVIELLTATFSELRSGESAEGDKLERLTTATMSTAECVDTSINTAIYSYYIDESKEMSPKAAAINLKGTIIKDDIEDSKKLRNYFDIIVKNRKGKYWKEFYDAGTNLF